MGWSPLMLLTLLLGSAAAATSAEVPHATGCDCAVWRDAFLHEFVCGSPVRRLTPGQRYHRDQIPAAAVAACGRQWTQLRVGDDAYWTSATMQDASGTLDYVSIGEDGIGVCVCQSWGDKPAVSEVKPAATAAGPSDQLIRCLCIVESRCNRDIGCVPDRGSDSCGPFQIKLPYWTDASAGHELGGDWKSCTTGAQNMACSVQTIQYYMARYAQRCVGAQRDPTDEDYARIHNGGPLGCRNPNTLPYWDRVRACMS